MRYLECAPLRSRYSSVQLLAIYQRLAIPDFVFDSLAQCEHSFYDCAYSPPITLWYLMRQRVDADHTLDAVVTDALAGGADALRECGKPLSQRIVSPATTAYSDARQRLPLLVLEGGLEYQGRQIRQMAEPLTWKQLQVNLIDGSTIRLRPHPEIVQEFPPHGNQYQQRRYWCLMRVAVSFCAHTGAVLGSATGPLSSSEQTLAAQLIRQAPAEQLHIGDRNLGVFRIVQVARHVKGHALVRLTKARARKLAGQHGLRSGLDLPVPWTPSRSDQQEPGCSSDPVAGRLIVQRVHRPGFRSQVLYLFTTLQDQQLYSAQELVELYGVRWLVELNLRYLKSQMDMDQLESKTPQMVRKEWLAGLMAYNLIRAVMLVAASQTGVQPLELSFSGARRKVEKFLEKWATQRRGRHGAWCKLLAGVARCTLPKRKKPRPSEPRAVRHLRLPYKALYGSRAKARRTCHRYVKNR